MFSSLPIRIVHTCPKRKDIIPFEVITGNKRDCPCRVSASFSRTTGVDFWAETYKNIPLPPTPSLRS